MFSQLQWFYLIEIYTTYNPTSIICRASFSWVQFIRIPELISNIKRLQQKTALQKVIENKKVSFLKLFKTIAMMQGRDTIPSLSLQTANHQLTNSTIFSYQTNLVAFRCWLEGTTTMLVSRFYKLMWINAIAFFPLQNRKAESVLKRKLQRKSKKLLNGENLKCKDCRKTQHLPDCGWQIWAEKLANGH